MLDAAEYDKAMQDIRGQIRPSVKIVKTSHGKIDASILLGIGAMAEDDLEVRKSHHDGDDDHEHDDFDSFVLSLPNPASADDLVAKLEATITAHNILRAKGFIALEGKDMRLVVQAVGNRIQHYFDRDWKDGEARTSRLVIIGEHGLNEAAITSQLQG